MDERFETLGNATIQLFQGSRPVLATDPWLVGTCYFGSWALDHPLTPEQISNVVNSDYIWISHGHPDHLHQESLNLLPRGKKILLPDHYDPEIKLFLQSEGFEVTVLAYRRWFQVSPSIQVMCLDNMNQDAVLVIRLGDALLINVNDSPVNGELSFLRRLIRAHPNDKTYLAALCSVDADMFNFVDQRGRSIVDPPEQRKPGAIWTVARLAGRLGVKNFCCSSSQHLYVRADSIWANQHRITWADIKQHWSRPAIRAIEPFVTVDVDSGRVTANHPTQRPDERQITSRTGDDDWDATLSPAEWNRVEAFFRRFEMIRRHLDFVGVTVGAETRRFSLALAKRGQTPPGSVGIHFHVPKQSLLETVGGGYLDDLLIANFMKVHLEQTRLYPKFTPIVAKLGGNAKVYTQQQYLKFLYRYFRRNPIGTIHYLFDIEKKYVIGPWLRRLAETLGVKRPLKYAYRSVLGDPISPVRGAALALSVESGDRLLEMPSNEKPPARVSVDPD